MATIKDLNTLIKSMKPRLVSGEFVFCTIKESALFSLNVKPLLIFREKEGISLIIKKKEAEKYDLSYKGVWALITLDVYSDLQAVGFLAKISTELAKKKISINTVSGYHHDHLFVPFDRSNEAIQILLKFSKK